MLDLSGTVVVAAVMAVCLTVAVTRWPMRPGAQPAVAAASGAWVGLAAAAAAAGALRNPLMLLILFVAPFVAAAALAVASPAARRAAFEVPMPALVGLNAVRIAGILFVLLAAAGRLAGPFPYFAGFGDIITGVAAIPLAWRAATGRSVIAWNVFGTLDLVVAVALGLMSAAGSPLQLIHAGVGSAAITVLPWALIPTVLVPFFLVVHVIVFAQIHRRSIRHLDARGVPLGSLGAAR